MTVAALALPSAMAFADLAGAPVSAGLYALLLPVVAYAVFGSARRVVIGPEGTVALLVAATIAPLASTGSTEYAADIDASAEVALREVLAGLHERNIELHVARAAVELRLQLDRVGRTDAIGAGHFHGTVAAVVEACRTSPDTPS